LQLFLFLKLISFHDPSLPALLFLFPISRSRMSGNERLEMDPLGPSSKGEGQAMPLSIAPSQLLDEPPLAGSVHLQHSPFIADGQMDLAVASSAASMDHPVVTSPVGPIPRYEWRLLRSTCFNCESIFNALDHSHTSTVWSTQTAQRIPRDLWIWRTLVNLQLSLQRN
jgi:hypothetical protein